MKICLLAFAMFTVCAGCSPARKNIQSAGRQKIFGADKPAAGVYSIDKLGLTMEIPVDFSVVTELKPIGDEMPEGLIWTAEKINMPLGRAALIELMYDKLDPLLQKNMTLDDYVEHYVLPELTTDGENMYLHRENLVISGLPARLVEVVNQYQDPEGTSDESMQMHIHEVILLKENQIFRWKFTINELDYPELDPVFHEYLGTIRFQ